jgi:nicotinamide-nucleotide amidase
MLDRETIAAAERLVDALSKRSWVIATAESCTGGLLAGAITSVPGSSSIFAEGVVTYSNDAKRRYLDVPSELLATFGAVSPEVATAMAVGLRARTQSDCTVSVTGIAGPGGGSDTKPVGLVYFALATSERAEAFEQHFEGMDRMGVRRASVLFALEIATGHAHGRL